MPFLDRLNSKLDKWNAKLEQLNAQLEQQQQQQPQQQQQQPSWSTSTSTQPPPVYPGPPPPLPPRPSSFQSPFAPTASSSVNGSGTTSTWQAPPLPPPVTNTTWPSPPTETWQPSQAQPSTGSFQAPPPPPAVVSVAPVRQTTPPAPQPAHATGSPNPVSSSSSLSITLTSDSSGELETLPILQETIDAHKAIEAATPPDVTSEYESHLKYFLDAISKTQEATAAHAEAARSAQYSQEVFSGGTDAWLRVCYGPAAETYRVGLSEIERNYWEIVRCKREGMGEGDVLEWVRAMEMSFRGCERLRMDWDQLEREKRDQESTAKSTWLYNNRQDEAVYEAVQQVGGTGYSMTTRSSDESTQQVERTKNYQDKIIQAESSSAAYARANQYASEIVGPFLRSFISSCTTRRTTIGNVISSLCLLLPTPPDPKDVDNVPPLTPKASEAFTRQLRETANGFDTLTFRINRVHERLDDLDKILQESSHQAELDSLLLKHYDPNDAWGNQSAWDTRNARQNAQSDETMALVNAQIAARDARRDEAQAVVKPCWDRIVKWERDRRNELMLRAAQGPGGAAFLSN
ncbi:hypothetical protein FRB90_007669, partial [Tulasnella sp. 427]